MDLSRRPLPDGPPLQKSFCRRIDRCCCNFIFLVPLTVVLGLTSWAVYVEAWSVSLGFISGGWGLVLALIGITFFAMTVYTYLLTVFTPPGSPSDNKPGYSVLPMTEPAPRITVKENGQPRYCQKCRYIKPDRAHHCSMCKRCILKMDHHCPWVGMEYTTDIANPGGCVGFANHKYFLLFLLYLTAFCILACLLCVYALWQKMAESVYVGHALGIRLTSSLNRHQFPGFCWLSYLASLLW